ncbi:protein kinase [Streptomyces sp. NPDC018693]|uniref:protein kinase domain-containing protein n=1 Tax=unclassified Streptomyces TaxID=2593676 RepID=UPI00379DD9C4
MTDQAALRSAGALPLEVGDPGAIGAYVPLGRLGSGGMGRVYLARPADDRPGLAAVKVIRPEYADDPEFRRRFEREAAVHGRVDTPHAPALLGTGFDDSLLWMATEYVPGLNLADAVRDCGRLAAPGLWRLVAELGQALAALAGAGVVHRDLKPSNVLLSSQGAHVIDFGISQAADASAITTTGSRVGTPAFMSPEYLREGRCDTASDVFSLAGTLIYAATGSAPFGAGTGVDVMHRVAFEEPKADVMAQLASVDPALSSLLAACLAKDPAHRPTPPQLIGSAHAAGHGGTTPWQEPLGTRLLERRRGYDALAHAPAHQTAHFRAPTQRVTTPHTPASFGPATPPGAYGTPYGAYASTPPGQYGGHPSTPPGSYGPPAPAVTIGSDLNRGARRRRATYLSLVTGLAVAAVAVGAFLMLRSSPGDDTGDDTAAGAYPTASGDATADDALTSPLPSISASPSASASPSDEAKSSESPKSEGEKTEKEEEKRQDAGTGGAEPTVTVTAAAPAPAPAPAKTSAAPSEPDWLTHCTHYSGSELTRYGDKNVRVTQVQCMLTKRGYSVGNAGVDGQFGQDTLTAVKRFQAVKGLETDGEVGPLTWAALREST